MTRRSNKRNRKVLQRSSPKDRQIFIPQERDYDIVQSLLDYGPLSRDQIQAILFRDNKSVTPVNRRLAALFHNGWVWRDDQEQRISEGRKPLIYFAEAKGVEALALHRDLEADELRKRLWDKSVGWPFLKHHQATNWLRIRITLSAASHGFNLPAWIDDRSLRHNRPDKVAVALTDHQGRHRIEQIGISPDGFFVIEVNDQAVAFFPELDRGTVTITSDREGRRPWSTRVKAYLAYLKSDRFKARFGFERFRVPVVCTSATRLENMLRATEAAGGRFTFYFTTLDEVMASDPLVDLIWRQPGTEQMRTLL